MPIYLSDIQTRDGRPFKLMFINTFTVPKTITNHTRFSNIKLPLPALAYRSLSSDSVHYRKARSRLLGLDRDMHSIECPSSC